MNICQFTDDNFCRTSKYVDNFAFKYEGGRAGYGVINVETYIDKAKENYISMLIVSDETDEIDYIDSYLNIYVPKSVIEFDEETFEKKYKEIEIINNKDNIIISYNTEIIEFPLLIFKGKIIS